MTDPTPNPPAEPRLQLGMPSPEPAARPAPKVMLCPYCGHAQHKADRCTACGGLFEPLSRKATQIAMGPWYLRDLRNPFRPGCSYDVLVRMIATGKIKSTTVLRGPTTRQFWSIARNVPGIAHLLGYCHACGKHVDPANLPSHCPHCNAPFKKVRQRNELGLQFATRQDAEAAQRALDRELALLRGDDAVQIDQGTGKPSTPTPRPEEEPASKLTAGDSDSPAAGDLLADVLGIDLPPAAHAEDVHALDFTPGDADPSEASMVPRIGPPPSVTALPENARARHHSGFFEPAVVVPAEREVREVVGTGPIRPGTRGVASDAPRGGRLPQVTPVVAVLLLLNTLVALGLLAYILFS